MALNQYLAFAWQSGANVLNYSAYSVSPLLNLGHQPGVALSEVANTTWRQTSTAAAGIAQMAVDLAGVDMNDDGNSTNFKNGVVAAINALIANAQFWKPGDIKGTLSTVSWTGWLVADGAAVSRTTYAALFAAIGTTYGSGDGSTTFNLPDLRGEFLRGLDNGRGVDAGRTLGSAQASMVQTHKHVMSWGEGAGTNAGDGYFGRTDTSVYRGHGSQSDINNRLFYTNDGTNYDGTVNAAGVIGNETRPRNVAVRWLIKT